MGGGHMVFLMRVLISWFFWILKFSKRDPHLFALSPRIWRFGDPVFGQVLATIWDFFWKSVKKRSTACRSHPTSFWRWVTYGYEHDLLFISVWSSLKCKSTVLVNLGIVWNLMRSMNFVKTYEVLCSSLFQIEFVWLNCRRKRTEYRWCCCGLWWSKTGTVWPK